MRDNTLNYYSLHFSACLPVGHMSVCGTSSLDIWSEIKLKVMRQWYLPSSVTPFEYIDTPDTHTFVSLSVWEGGVSALPAVNSEMLSIPYCGANCDCCPILLVCLCSDHLLRWLLPSGGKWLWLLLDLERLQKSVPISFTLLTLLSGSSLSCCL